MSTFNLLTFNRWETNYFGSLDSTCYHKIILLGHIAAYNMLLPDRRLGLRLMIQRSQVRASYLHTRGRGAQANSAFHPSGAI